MRSPFVLVQYGPGGLIRPYSGKGIIAVREIAARGHLFISNRVHPYQRLRAIPLFFAARASCEAGIINMPHAHAKRNEFRPRLRFAA